MHAPRAGCPKGAYNEGGMLREAAQVLIKLQYNFTDHNHSHYCLFLNTCLSTYCFNEKYSCTFFTSTYTHFSQ